MLNQENEKNDIEGGSPLESTWLYTLAMAWTLCINNIAYTLAKISSLVKIISNTLYYAIVDNLLAANAGFELFIKSKYQLDETHEQSKYDDLTPLVLLARKPIRVYIIRETNSDNVADHRPSPSPFTPIKP